jgi:AcrR family transcriptional regulator
MGTLVSVMPVPTSTDGQPLGERGVRTRHRILEAVAAAIEQQGLRGLRLADVANEVGFSPPAFYQYFNDLKTFV